MKCAKCGGILVKTGIHRRACPQCGAQYEKNYALNAIAASFGILCVILSLYWSRWAGALLLVIGIVGIWPLRARQWKEIGSEQ